MRHMKRTIIFSSILGVSGLFLGLGVVLAAGSPPVWYGMSNKAVFTGETLEFFILARDSDGDSLIYSAYNIPSGATFNQDRKSVV